MSPPREVANHFVATHPDSLFVRELLVARVEGTTRYGLRSNNLSVHLRDGTVKRRTLDHPRALMTTPREVFHIELPEDPGLAKRLSELTG